MDGRGNPDAIFWIALSLALGAVLLAVALGPRGGEEVRLGSPENPPQEDRAAPDSLAPEGSDSSGQQAPEDYSPQPAPTDTVTAPTETVPTETAPAPTDTVPTDTVPTDTRPVVDRVPSRIMVAPEEHLVEPGK